MTVLLYLYVELPVGTAIYNSLGNSYPLRAEGVGNNVSAITRLRRRDRRVGKSSSLLVSSERLVAIEVLVDDEGHSALAVEASGLRAVEPQRSLVLDGEGEDVGGFAGLSHEVEAREDGIVVDGLAGLLERGLGEAVVLGEEVDFDEVADLSDDVFGLEVEASICGSGTGEDAVDDTGLRGVKGSGSGEAEESESGNSDGGEGDHFD